jgi:hypothetical protein
MFIYGAEMSGYVPLGGAQISGYARSASVKISGYVPPVGRKCLVFQNVAPFW